MTHLQYARRDEQWESGQGPYDVDPTPLVGDWLNTNASTNGIARAAISNDRDGVRISLWPAGTSRAEPRYSMTADVVYSNSPSATAAMAVSARYEDESMATTLEANLSLGLLVIATCHTFKNGGDRSNYFSREFFHYRGAPSMD
jgi:hypothetical protein